jgi:hypothetical protein
MDQNQENTPVVPPVPQDSSTVSETPQEVTQEFIQEIIDNQTANGAKISVTDEAQQGNQNESSGVTQAAEPKVTQESVDVEVGQSPVLNGQVEVVKPNVMGRPTKYNEEMLKKTQQYFDECLNGVKDRSGKIIKQPRVPYIEELELMLDISDDTIVNWAKDEDKPDFLATYLKIKKLYKLRLKQLLVRGKTNPLGAKFLLEAECGVRVPDDNKAQSGDIKVTIGRG